MKRGPLCRRHAARRRHTIIVWLSVITTLSLRHGRRRKMQYEELIDFAFTLPLSLHAAASFLAMIMLYNLLKILL